MLPLPRTGMETTLTYAYANIVLSAPGELDAYREKAGQALAKHGGKVLQASPSQTVLEGTRDETGIGVILEFPDADAAHAWINDPELAQTHALRRGAGSSTITLLG